MADVYIDLGTVDSSRFNMSDAKTQRVGYAAKSAQASSSLVIVQGFDEAGLPIIYDGDIAAVFVQADDAAAFALEIGLVLYDIAGQSYDSFIPFKAVASAASGGAEAQHVADVEFKHFGFPNVLIDAPDGKRYASAFRIYNPDAGSARRFQLLVTFRR